MRTARRLADSLPGAGVLIECCDNLSVAGVTIDYSPLPYVLTSVMGVVARGAAALPRVRLFAYAPPLALRGG